VPHNLQDVKECNLAKFAEYHHNMSDAGIYLSPSQFELNFISTAHTAEDMEQFINTAKQAVTHAHCS